ncbi:DUF4175 family protein [Roseivirga seohaensis]|uniref:DUF4175 family protein n=1 Tax=Roseivirga seohaensis TaxID=1914963 RepID=UPI003BAAE130
MSSNQLLKQQLQAYKKKFYTNRLIKGFILFLAFFLSLFIIANAFEFSARLSGGGRAILFFSFVFGSLLAFFWFIGKNLYHLRNAQKHLSNEEASKQIGAHFPEISDKLLNIIQLEKLNTAQNELLLASIEQKSKEVGKISFVSAIDYKGNRKYLRYVIGPGAIIVILLLFIPQFLTESSTRIINYNTEFLPEAPFSFTIKNTDFKAFKGENFTLEVNTEGRSIPENLYVWTNNRKVKANKTGPESFQYTFTRIQADTKFSLEAESITSSEYKIEVVSRPSLSLFNLELEFPKYLKREKEQLENSGNVSVPEGTIVKWKFDTDNTDEVKLNFPELDIYEKAKKSSNGAFNYEQKISKSSRYSIQLKNEYSLNRDSLVFAVEAVKDRYPEITLDQYQDTVLFKSLVLGGNITDDHGFSRLSIFYQYQDDQNFEELPLELNKDLNSQSYYKVFNLDSAKITAGAEIKYYVQVSDNDGVNGSKSVKTSTYSFKIPSKEEIEEEIDRTSEKVQKDIDKTLKEAKELNEKLSEVDERLKTKKELDWQDEKLMQDILKQKDQLAEKLEELKKENQLNNMKKEQFSPQNDKIQEKMNQLQELMNEILDDETKKLYDELKELLEEQGDISEFRDKIEEMKNKGGDLEKEIERTLELFKKLQFDMKLEQNIKELEQAIKDQEQLIEETQNEKSSSDSLSQKQAQEKKDLEKLQEQMEKLNELNEERKTPDDLPSDLKEQFEEIKEEQEKAQEELQQESEQENSQEKSEEEQEKGQEEQNEKSEEEQQKGKPSQQRQNATKAQQKAAEKMKEMKKNLESMQGGMEMEQQQENLEFLKELVDNLVTLSFNQEDLMNSFREIRESDPRFVDLTQKQLKLKDDSKIVQDSLISLSQRVFQISSFVMREVSEMNRQMDGALDELKEKRINQATGKQQFTMTSINNLALLLDDIVQQMQNQMASSSNKGNKKNKPMPGGLSELQKQLSEQISELKKSGKSGRQLSEELAKLAAEQQRLRNALENFETGVDGDNLGEKIDKLIEQMEKNEEDLINKNLTEETVERQQEILTRLLEAENAMNERGEDEERKGETATDYNISVPESLNEYLKAKEKEIELLKTIPAVLNPYYKQETNKYFKKIKQKN